MPAPAAELQKAIFAALGSDAALIAALGGAHIYDKPRSVFPSISFGRTGVYDWSTGTEKDTEQLFTLHIWSKAKGDAETLGLMELALSRLAGSPLFLEGGHPVDLRLEFAEARYDQDLAVYHGLLRYRAVTLAPAAALH
jgi:hypothetical protein